ncbi:MAG: squalene/phytoene synthase family protein [Verrucomicrobiota bacterium]|jgi:farnesyl-diphosphate farnesyltransferase|nr:squalene/phytoene synthase family protein [Verrucomicrobiota bacterium]
MVVTDELLGSILRDVSRAFYLTLRVLPASVRSQIALAYLLARISDTIADTQLVPAEKRIQKLQQFRARIRDEGAPPVDFTHLARDQNNEAERVLLQHSGEAIGLLDKMEGADRGQVQLVLETITRGQELDLERFGDGHKLKALKTGEDLDDYTYRVAGCVGEFWTRLTRAHCFANTKIDEQHFVQNSIRFGQGLQLVNVLRDLPHDLANGRCYLPAVDLAVAGLQPQDLRDAKNWPRLKPVFMPWLEKATDHLAAGWHYTLQIPHEHYRLRLASAWPALMGSSTLGLVRNANPLQPDQHLKISRGTVRSIIWSTLWRVPFKGPWKRLFSE